MGADATAVLEIQWSAGHWVPFATFHFYDRSYEVFGELNGVRRALRHGPGHTELIEQGMIVEPRGFPPDLSTHTQELASERGVYQPTWITRIECELIDAQILRLHAAGDVAQAGARLTGDTWPAILACMRSTPRPTRLVFWTDQS